MEAALRTAYALLAGEELKNPDIISVRGLNNSLVEATVPIPLKAQGGKIFELRVAVVNGALQDLKNVMKIINEDKDRWHFIEVMNCPAVASTAAVSLCRAPVLPGLPRQLRFLSNSNKVGIRNE